MIRFKSFISFLISLGFIIATSLILNSCAAEEKKERDIRPSGAKWWKEAIVYQIYPRSFKDSDGDGVGDLRGIIEKLDYIKSLGVTAVWLNPIYESPNADNGYDISNYEKIMLEFGKMEDFDELLQGLHDRGIKFVMDVVVNHSSDEHEWFKQSRSSRDNPYRDYYHWWPAEKGTPPDRWSFFDPEGNAWRYDSLTNAYYLHYFGRKQPDLKWENPKVRQEVYDVMKFWAEKGVDGFRLDAFQYVSKDTTFPALPDGYEGDIGKHYGMGANLHTYLREMYDEVLGKYDVFAVAEGAGSGFADAHSLVDADRKELQMAYHFDVVGVGYTPEGYELEDFRGVFTRWDSAFSKKGWVSVYLANHDLPRMVSKLGNDAPGLRQKSTQLLNTFLMTMRGTPYAYYGDELGMTNVDMPDINDYQDISALNGYQKAMSEGKDSTEFMVQLNYISRENGRTPMQWNDEAYAGFSTETPWMRMNPNYTDINVEEQEQDSASCLNHFRKATALRNAHLSLVYGEYKVLAPDHEMVYAYSRTLEDEKLAVFLNFSDQKATLSLPDSLNLGKVLLNNYSEIQQNQNQLELSPWQAVVYEFE